MICLTDLFNGVMIILPADGVVSISPITGITGSMVVSENGRSFYVCEPIETILKKIEEIS